MGENFIEYYKNQSRFYSESSVAYVTKNSEYKRKKELKCQRIKEFQKRKGLTIL